MKEAVKIAPVTPESSVISQQLNIQAELIKMLYQQAHTALIGVIATATGIAIVFFNEVHDFIVISWLLVIYGLSFIRYISIRKFKALDKQAIDVVHWGDIFAFFAFLSGLSWGSASIIFFTPDNLLLFHILTLIIIAMSVGSLAALSAHPKSFYLFVIPAMLPMIWRYLSTDEQNYMIFGILLFVFNFALFSIVKVNHQILRNSINLRFENIGLIDQLTKQKEKAEKANIAKTKFLAAASHDLRQPLHAMGLFLGILEEKVEKEEQKAIVQKTQKSSEALNDLLDSLLDISKLDAGVIQVDSKPFPVNNLFVSLKDEFAVSASENNLKIKFVETKLWIDSDYRIVERIMRNFISNAIRYTHSGGIVVGCRRIEGRLLLAVYDTGIGINEDDIQIVFDEFHQLHNPERDRSRGLGLGLAIVKRMAKLINMPLWTKSVQGVGSSFGLIMPCYENTSPQVSLTDTTKSSAVFDGMSVLVIDDEEAVRESLTELLHSWHCEVIASASGAEAVRMIQNVSVRPDIILADYRLRDNETGIDVIQRVNSLYSHSEIPAIIITGDTAPERIKEVESSGYKILNKPVSPVVLRALLAES